MVFVSGTFGELTCWGSIYSDSVEIAGLGEALLNASDWKFQLLVLNTF